MNKCSPAGARTAVLLLMVLFRMQAKKINTIVAPLPLLNSAFQIRWSDDLYEEISRHELEKYIKYGRHAPPGGASA
jgi:hypothetical protein